jgi:hypothetical protein
MNMLNITLKGGVVKEFEAGTTVLEVAKSLGGGFYKQVTCGMVDGEIVDLRYPLEKDCELILCSFEEEAGKKGLLAYRHPCDGPGCAAALSRGQICHRPGH